jgi:hypothetical protein
LTSLHYTLIALGVFLVGAMFLYNVFQEYRSRKQAERLFGLADPAARRPDEVAAGDAGAGGGRVEPNLGLARAEVEEEPIRLDDFPLPEDSGPGAEAQYPDQEPAGPYTQPHVQPMAPESPLDGAIEYVARLRHAQPVAVSFSTLLDNLRRISKPIRLVGQREDGEWEPVLGHTVKPFRTVELGLLLADRAGPVSEVQIDTFCRRLYEFATEHGGAVSCQDKAEALERARNLDAFGAEVDMLIGLNVIPSTGQEFGLSTVHELAERAGLTRSADGTFLLRDEAGRALFNLAIHADANAHDGGDHACQGVSLLFDVPRVAHGIQAFDHMAVLGFELAGQLGGQLVDDGGRLVSRESLLKDRRRLESLYASMDSHGIPAGSERALRLFA